MGRIRFLGKRNKGRCIYCREALSEGEADPCVGCGALVHEACRAELKGCPTLGCDRAGEATRQGREERRADRVAGRRSPRELGRMTRRPPSLSARVRPYGRIALRTVFYLAVFVLIFLFTAAFLTHPNETIEFFRGDDGNNVILMFVVPAGIWGVMGLHWLLRLPGFWRRVVELLDDGEVQAMTFQTFKVASSDANHVRLTDVNGRVQEHRAGGFFEPYWLYRYDGQRVFVHGGPDDEVRILEFEDGAMAVLDTKR